MQSFLEPYGLKNLISEPTCYKNPENSCSIDLIVANSLSSFQNSCAIKTGLPGFHKMTITVEDDLSEVKTKTDLSPR